MISQETLSQIEAIVGSQYLKLEKAQISEFGSDGTKLHAMPEAVAIPGCAEEISSILMLATRKRFPVVVRGAGSGMSGGAIPIHGGLVLAMDRFNKILSIDKENMTATVEAGVITADLKDAAAREGLLYPPDPASIKISTIGGNLAECAGGLRAVKYGVTRDYVLGLRVVLPTGEVLNTGVETMKGVAGYDLTRLIVGSEGTLAVIVSATVRLLPMPETSQAMVAFFSDVAASTNAVTKILRSGIIPAVMELVDGLCLSVIREEIQLRIPEGSGAMLLIELDGDRLSVSHGIKKVEEQCRAHGCINFITASSDQDSELLWEARRNISPSLYKLRPHKVSEDVVVPRNKMPQMAHFLEELSRVHKIPIPVFGHAGDGNLHVNIMLDTDDPEEVRKAHTIVTKLFTKVLELGGTITGEHGVGITKRRYLHMEIPPAGLSLMSRIKKAFDPAGILNPDKILP
ncbi:MAG: glycolate oxidase subunit GlcD [Deltaproteobacteria bacterium]|nr:MAG: glycolate oxidase subunit GlcD [Deltaproteobacteria bacterium]